MSEKVMTLSPVRQEPLGAAHKIGNRAHRLGSGVIGVAYHPNLDPDFILSFLDEGVTQVWLLGPQSPEGIVRNRVVAQADKQGIPIRPVSLEVTDDQLREILHLDNNQNNEEQ